MDKELLTYVLDVLITSIEKFMTKLDAKDRL